MVENSQAYDGEFSFSNSTHDNTSVLRPVQIFLLSWKMVNISIDDVHSDYEYAACTASLSLKMFTWNLPCPDAPDDNA